MASVRRSLPLNKDASVRPMGSDFLCFIVQRGQCPAYELRSILWEKSLRGEGREDLRPKAGIAVLERTP